MPKSNQLILKSFLSPGDIVMMTATVRDLHKAFPGWFKTDVRTSCSFLWDYNPLLSRLSEKDKDVRVINMKYPLVHSSNERPYHFIHGYHQYLGDQLDLQIPVTLTHGDVYLSDDEKQMPESLREYNIPDGFWIVMAGGKYDFTAKWWNPASYQAVIDYFQDRICFVQCGETHHFHPPLRRVINLVGKTSKRDFIRLMYHAAGVLCPVTYAMHLAAAVPNERNEKQGRACVVVAGGREPAHWASYSHHQFISNVGALPCCRNGGCWKSRCQLVGDGDEKDRNRVCDKPVQVSDSVRIPRCMDMIKPTDVIRRIETYYEGGVLQYA